MYIKGSPEGKEKNIVFRLCGPLCLPSGVLSGKIKKSGDQDEFYFNGIFPFLIIVSNSCNIIAVAPQITFPS